MKRPSASLTPREFGDAIGKSKSTILNEIQAGKLRAGRIGNRYVIDPSEALRYVNSIAVTPPQWLLTAAARYHARP